MKKIDIHTHVLPEVDDGAKNWEVCLEMLARSAECGVEKVIATPHYLPWRPGNTPNQIRELCMETQKKLEKKHGISIDIYPGNEIYYNMDVIQLLKEGKVLSLANSRYILVEFGTGESYQVLCRAVKDFRDAGYIPIVAHVERYACLRQEGKLQELKEMGALFQMNVEAIQGGILNADSRWSKKCLVSQKIDFLASDMHGLQRRTPLKSEDLSWLQKKIDIQYQKQLLYKNAQRILDTIGL